MLVEMKALNTNELPFLSYSTETTIVFKVFFMNIFGVQFRVNSARWMAVPSHYVPQKSHKDCLKFNQKMKSFILELPTYRYSGRKSNILWTLFTARDWKRETENTFGKNPYTVYLNIAYELTRTKASVLQYVLQKCKNRGIYVQVCSFQWSMVPTSCAWWTGQTTHYSAVSKGCLFQSKENVNSSTIIIVW